MSEVKHARSLLRCASIVHRTPPFISPPRPCLPASSPLPTPSPSLPRALLPPLTSPAHPSCLFSCPFCLYFVLTLLSSPLPDCICLPYLPSSLSLFLLPDSPHLLPPPYLSSPPLLPLSLFPVCLPYLSSLSHPHPHWTGKIWGLAGLPSSTPLSLLISYLIPIPSPCLPSPLPSSPSPS